MKSWESIDRYRQRVCAESAMFQVQFLYAVEWVNGLGLGSRYQCGSFLSPTSMGEPSKP